MPTQAFSAAFIEHATQAYKKLRGPQSMRQMCEFIATQRFVSDDAGVYATPEQIYTYSPTGELAAVFDWYDTACTLWTLRQYNKLLK